MKRFVFFLLFIVSASKGFAQQVPSIDFFIGQLKNDTTVIFDSLRNLGFLDEQKIKKGKQCGCGDLMKQPYKQYSSITFKNDSVSITVCMKANTVTNVSIYFVDHGANYVTRSLLWMIGNGFTKDPNSSTGMQRGDEYSWHGVFKTDWSINVFARSLTSF